MILIDQRECGKFHTSTPPIQGKYYVPISSVVRKNVSTLFFIEGALATGAIASFVTIYGPRIETVTN